MADMICFLLLKPSALAPRALLETKNKAKQWPPWPSRPDEGCVTSSFVQL